MVDRFGKWLPDLESIQSNQEEPFPHILVEPVNAEDSVQQKNDLWVFSKCGALIQTVQGSCVKAVSKKGGFHMACCTWSIKTLKRL